MTLTVHAAIATHIGRRSNNEDHAGASPGQGVYVVADGMGGYEGGEVASRTAVDALLAFVDRAARDPAGTWPCREDKRRRFEENLLCAACEEAHRQVVAKREGLLGQMGSTVVAALVRGGLLTVAHVGDSRAYRLKDGTLEPLTRDHSLRAELEAQGLTTFAPRNIVTRALGVERHDAEVRSLPLGADETVLLCTDGLSEAMDREQLEAILRGATDPEAAARELVARALEAGAHDNVTVLVLRTAAGGVSQPSSSPSTSGEPASSP